MGKAGKIKGDGARQIVSVTELCVVCVCVQHLNRCKTSAIFCNISFFNSLSISRGGHRGPGGGSVTNEETSPGPVMDR